MDKRLLTAAAEWAVLLIMAAALSALAAAYFATGEALLLALLAVVAALTFWAVTLRPVGVDAEQGGFVLKRPLGWEKVDVAKVAAKLDTEEVFKSLKFCAGWRVWRYSMNAWCASRYGGVKIFSTRGCSDTWLLVETPEGSKYLICCEEKDSWICKSAHQSPAEGVVTTRR